MSSTSHESSSLMLTAECSTSSCWAISCTSFLLIKIPSHFNKGHKILATADFQAEASNCLVWRALLLFNSTCIFAQSKLLLLSVHAVFSNADILLPGRRTSTEDEKDMLIPAPDCLIIPAEKVRQTFLPNCKPATKRCCNEYEARLIALKVPYYLFWGS